MITPFYVRRDTRHASGYAIITCWSIVHVGHGVVCYVDDVTYAYRIVDLLNEDEARCPSVLLSTPCEPASG